MQKAILATVSVLCISVWGLVVFFYLQGNQEINRAQFMAGYQSGLIPYQAPNVVIEQWEAEQKLMAQSEDKEEPIINEGSTEERPEQNYRVEQPNRVITREIAQELGNTEAVSIDSLLYALNITLP